MQWSGLIPTKELLFYQLLQIPTHGHQAMQIGMLAFPKRLKDRKFLMLEKNMIKLDQNKEWEYK